MLRNILLIFTFFFSECFARSYMVVRGYIGECYKFNPSYHQYPNWHCVALNMTSGFPSVEQFSQNVTQYMAKGWHVSGGVLKDGSMLYQAMIKN